MTQGTVTQGPLAILLDPTQGRLRDGIWVSNALNERTVWDQLADTDPLQAVISAESAQAAWAKSAPQIEQIASCVDSHSILLDVGCGYGRIAQYLLPERPIGAYVGIDSSFEMLGIFKRRYDSTPPEQKTPVMLVNSDITTLPFPAASVDVVVVSAVFLHNHKSVVKAAMAEVGRVLKPGGKLLVFSSFPRRATAMGLQGSLHQFYLNRRGTPERNGPVRYYSHREVARMLQGFADVRILPTGFEVVPKSIIGTPPALDKLYRRFVSGPANVGLGRLLKRWQPAFARHYDVIAIR